MKAEDLLAIFKYELQLWVCSKTFPLQKQKVHSTPINYDEIHGSSESVLISVWTSHTARKGANQDTSPSQCFFFPACIYWKTQFISTLYCSSDLMCRLRLWHFGWYTRIPHQSLSVSSHTSGRSMTALTTGVLFIHWTSPLRSDVQYALSLAPSDGDALTVPQSLIFLGLLLPTIWPDMASWWLDWELTRKNIQHVQSYTACRWISSVGGKIKAFSCMAITVFPLGEPH